MKPQPGDWVVNNDWGRIARIHRDSDYGDEPFVDLILYARDGTKIGRESPSMGGPKGFEPACSTEFWFVIRQPSFPLPKYGSLQGVLRLRE